MQKLVCLTILLLLLVGCIAAEPATFPVEPVASTEPILPSPTVQIVTSLPPTPQYTPIPTSSPIVSSTVRPIIMTPRPYTVTFELVGQIGGAVRDFQMQAPYAYMGSGPRLLVLDLSRPTSPQIVGTSGILPGLVNALAVQGQYVYAAAGSRLVVLDLSDPYTPNIVGQSQELSVRETQDLVASGDYVYLTDSLCGRGGCTGSLRAIDITDPSAPYEVGQIDMPGIASEVEVIGEYAYVASEGLRIVDASRPADLQVVDSMTAHVSAMAHTGDYLYLDTSDGLWTVDVTDPADPQILASYPHGGWTEILAVEGTYAYSIWQFCDVCGCADTLYVDDISDPSGIKAIGSLDNLPGRASSLVLLDGWAYYVTTGGDLWILDIEDPSRPHKIGELSTVGMVDDLELSDEYAYVMGNRLSVIDVVEPSMPYLVGSIGIGECRIDLEFSEGYAYVLSMARVRTFDLRVPQTPVQVSDMTSGWWECTDLTVAEGFAYVCGEWIIDVADPSNPQEIGALDAYYSAVTVSEGVLYGSSYGLAVIDMTDPASAHEVGFEGGLYQGQDIELVNERAYVLTSDGLGVVDVSDRANPELMGFLHLDLDRDWPSDLTVSGEDIYVVTREGGLRVVSVADPTTPVEVGFYDTIGKEWAVGVRDDFVFIASGDAGLYILRAIPEL